MRKNYAVNIVGILVFGFGFFNNVIADEVQEPKLVEIRLRVEAPNQTLFDNNIVVNPCIATSTQATSTSGFCALEQSGLNPVWKWFDFGPMLETYGGLTGDWTNYWSWYSDLDLGQTGLDSHALSAGEHLLLTYGVNPLKIIQSATTTFAGATTTLSIKGFGYDANWNPVWSDQENYNLEIASTTFAVASSTYEYATTTLGTFALRVTKNGFAPSEYYYLEVVQEPTTTPTPSPSPSTPPPPVVTASFNIPSAISYLASQQKSDGSYGADLYTDWAAIALSGNSGTARENLKNYLTNNSFSGSSVTDYERHAMALMSLGINPYTANGENYIKKITDSFDGTQIGDSGLWNDDIFAIFPLMKAGYTTNDDVIKKTVAFIISRQSPNGSFGSIDITAAAIQSLSLVQGLPDVSDSILKAKNSLKSSQASGGFGTSFATSWSMQAISALGEANDTWKQGSETPLTYLALFQQDDGGVEAKSMSPDNRVWATAYAIPAAQGKTWASLMTSFSKPAETVNTATVATTPISTPLATSTATSTPATATSTQITIATSTNTAQRVQRISPSPQVLAFVASPTSTPEIIDEIPDTVAAVGATANPKSNSLPYILGAFGIIAIMLGGYKWLKN